MLLHYTITAFWLYIRCERKPQHMKTFLSLLFIGLLTFSSQALSAQRIYPCADVSSSGEPSDVGYEWTITPDGGFVYILFKNNRTIYDDVVYFFIDIMNDGKYEEFDTKSIKPERGNDYAVLDFKFTKAGEYKVQVINAEYETVATEYLTINMKGSSTSGGRNNNNNNNNNVKIDADYYANSEIIACEDVEDNVALGVGTNFRLSKNEGTVIFQVKNGKPIESVGLVVKIYKRGRGSADYDEYVTTKNFEIKTTWDKPYFSYQFEDIGEYKLAIYNEEDVWINNGYVTITRR